MVEVGVIGAGVIGLSTALNLQRELPGCSVTVMADRFETDTTSDGAAGIVRPSAELLDGLDVRTSRQWLTDSWCHFDRLAHSSEAGRAGVSILSGYHLWDAGKAYVKKPILIEEYSYHYRECSPRELRMFPGKTYEKGAFFTTQLIECRYYLPWLRKRFEWGGGRIVKRTVQHFKELADEFDLVANCSGLRTKDLLDDPLLVPLRGQMFRVKAPWLKHFCYTDNNMWIVPCMDDVVVGGTRQEGDSGQDIRHGDAEDIWRRAVDIWPSLQVDRVWAGLRPYRRPVRVEMEQMVFDNGKSLKVLHNYGHGGNGVTLSWGTAMFAARLARGLAGKAGASHL